MAVLPLGKHWGGSLHLFQSRGWGGQVSLDCGHITPILASIFTWPLPFMLLFAYGHKSYWIRIHPNDIAST